MKTQTVKSFLDVHTWTGLGAGLALFIAFYAGAITVFTYELDRWDSFSTARVAEPSPAAAQRLLDMALAAQPGMYDNLRLDLPGRWYPTYQVRWFERLQDGSFKTHEFRLNIDGSLDREPDPSHLSGLIYRLHYTAGLPDTVGLYTLGVICVIYGIALVSGVVLFLPGFFKDLFALRPGSNKKRFWLDAHNIVGMLSLPWHIMFAWSSAILCIGVFLLAPFQFLVFGEDLTEKFGAELGLPPHLEPTGEPAPLLAVDELLAIAGRELPNMTLQQLRFSHVGDSNSMVTVRGDANTDTLLSSAAVNLNASTGEVLSVSDPLSATPGAQFYSGLIDLHFVTFGGYTAKWAYFFLGLAGAFLFYSGNLLFIETRRKRRQMEQPQGTLFLARLNSGVCLGCMAGISAAFLASRGLTGWEHRADFTEYTYYTVFFGAIVWSFTRHVASASRDLLYLCALFTAAIPLFDLIFAGTPYWRSALSGHWALLCVDLLAVMGAVAFWLMARKLEARSSSGDPNSVWAGSTASRDETASIEHGL